MGISIMGWFAWILMIIICVAILWSAQQPGHRRRKQKEFEGEDRREDKTITDFLAQPIFARPCTTIRDRITITQDEEVNINVPLSGSHDSTASVEIAKTDSPVTKK